MNKNYIYIFIICAIFFIPTFLRPAEYTVAGADSYYFLNQIFHKSNYTELSTPISNFIFSIFPENYLYIKIIMFLITLISLIIFYETIELNSKGSGLFGVFATLSVFFFSQVFFCLEDDLLAMPFLMISIFFLIKYNKESIKSIIPFTNINVYVLISAVYLILAILIWKFCVFFIFVYLLISRFNIIYIIGSVFLFPFYNKLLTSILPNMRVSENAIGIIGIITVLCFLWIFIKFKEIKSQYKIAIIIFSIFTIINPKMMFAIVPILILATCDYHFTLNKLQKLVITIFYICLFIGTINYQVMDFPNKDDYNMLMYAQQQANDHNKALMVNWGYGYFSIYNNIDSKYFGQYKPQDTNNMIYYTEMNTYDKANCKILKKGSRTIVVSC